MVEVANGLPHLYDMKIKDSFLSQVYDSRGTTGPVGHNTEESIGDTHEK